MDELEVFPDSWAETSLNQILLVLESGSRPKGGVSHYQEGIPSLGGEHLNSSGGFKFDKIRFVPESFAQSMKKGLIAVDDILVVKDGATTGKVSYVSSTFPYKRAVINEHLFLIRPQKEIDKKWIFYQLWSREGKRDILKDFKGAAQGGITNKFTEHVRIVLPPIAEQRRIVEKIEELFSEIDKGDENLCLAQEQLKVYRQSLLKHAFEGKYTAQWRKENKDLCVAADVVMERIKSERQRNYQQKIIAWEAGGRVGPKPKSLKSLAPLNVAELIDLPDLPKGWSWSLIGDSCLELALGKMLDKEKNKGELKPYLRNINVRWGNFNLDNLLEMRFEKDEFSRYGLKDGDLVICEGGEPGRSAVWRDLFGMDMLIQKALHRVRFSESINPFFVQKYFELCASNRRLEKMFTGTTIKHLTGERLARMAIPICSIDEQIEILRILESKLSQIEKLQLAITTSLDQSQAMRQSILQKAFSGQLVPQDPNDEPASELLARIKVEVANSKPIRKKKAA